MQSRNLTPTSLIMLAVCALFTISCSSPGSGIISKFNSNIGSDATKKEFKKSDVLYTWNNVSITKTAELKAIIEDYMKISPSDTLPLSPYYDAQNHVVPGKFLKYWVYEQSKFGVELNYIITGKTMTVEVRITEKIGAQ
ncbi:MAG: hypothetical protein H6Q17_929 [Bacteroidetes bacterium]|nr:hypothetical protein [Bacteroidota bacterium]